MIPNGDRSILKYTNIVPIIKNDMKIVNVDNIAELIISLDKFLVTIAKNIPCIIPNIINIINLLINLVCIAIMEIINPILTMNININENMPIFLILSLKYWLSLNIYTVKDNTINCNINVLNIHFNNGDFLLINLLKVSSLFIYI